MNRKLLTAAVITLSSAAFVGCSNNKHDHAEAEACHSEDVLMTEAKPKAPEKAAPVAKFGTDFTVNDAAQTVTVEQVLADPKKYEGQRVRLTGGNVTSVCAKKGCWLRVAPKSAVAAKDARFSDIFIKFTDPSTGRLVPMEAVGHNTELEGVVAVGRMTEASARHYKMDAGAPKEEIEKIVGPQPQVVLQKASVAVQGLEQPKAGA